MIKLDSVYAKSVSLDNNIIYGSVLGKVDDSESFIKTNKKKILFISSYNLNLDSVINQIAGVKSKVHDDSTIYYYFMDTKRVPKKTADKNLAKEIESKYSELLPKVPYDLIIASDDAAFDFVVENENRYFKDLPIVFLGVNNVKKAYEVGNKKLNINGIIEAYPIVETLKMATRIYPNATQIVGILDNSLTGESTKESFNNCINAFPKQKLIQLNVSNYTKDEVVKKIKSYDKKTILIYLIATSFKDGERLTINQTIRLFSDEAKIPIFRPNESGVGSGALGGKVMRFVKMGEAAGRKVQALLNNSGHKMFPVVKARQFTLFDAQVMKKFNINKKLLPEETIYINKDLNIFEKHEGLFENFILAIISIFILLIFLVYDNREKKKKFNFEKKLNHRMNQNIAKLEVAMNNANLFYSNYDIEKNELEVGKNVQNMFGVPKISNDYPNSWVKRGILTKHEASDFKRILENFKKSKPEDNYKVSFVQRHKTNNREDFNYQKVDSIGIYDLKGNLNQIFETKIDITDQVQAERRYQRQIEDFATFTPDTVISFRFNLETGDYQSSRTKFSEYFDLDKLDNIKKLISNLNNLNECKFENTRETISLEKIKELFEEGKEGFNFYSKSKFNNGIVEWMKGYGRFSIHPRSKEKEILLQLVKNTKNHLHKEALNKITENTYESVFLVYGKIDKFEILAGKPFLDTKPGEIYDNFANLVLYAIQKDYNPNKKEEDKNLFRYENILKRLKETGSYNTTFVFKEKDGTERKKNVNYSLIDREEKIFTIVVQDITEAFENERKMNNELKNALVKAERANAAKSEFLALMSHDIRTPMNAILLLAKLGESADLSKSVIKEYFRNISSSGTYLLALLTDILDISKLDNNKMKIERVEVKGSEIINEVKNIFKTQIKEKNISFTIDVEKPELLEIPLYIDGVKLKQIIVNLISNSYKFTPPGGSIKVKVYDMNLIHEVLKEPIYCALRGTTDCYEKDSLHYKISVEDSGIGMSEKFIPKLFNPFEQESKDYKTELIGTGLGTTIIKKLVDLMGGTIKVSSEIGKGTIFELELVAEVLCKKTLKLKEINKEIDLDKIDFSNLNILLVEDNKLNAIVAERILSKRNVHIKWVKSGSEAIEQIGKSELFTYDAILMDIRMPGIDGWETTKQIRAMDRQDTRTVPIIAMTANVFEDEVKKSLEVGMNEHLSKPIDIRKLFEVLAKYCNL